MFLEEIIVKLTFYFIIGFSFGLSQFFFLSYTENMTKRKGVYNIASYFPLSYGILFPLMGIFLGGPYYPIGMVNYPNSNIQFNIDHSSSRIFSYMVLLLMMVFSFGLMNYIIYQYNFPFQTILAFNWFLQVLLTFLIFNLIPVFPTVLGSLVLKELKYKIIKLKKIEYFPFFNYFAKIGICIFVICILSINYHLLDRKINFIINFLFEIFSHINYFIVASSGIFGILVYLVYHKKKEYKEYIDYIKNALAESFLKDQKDKKSR